MKMKSKESWKRIAACLLTGVLLIGAAGCGSGAEEKKTGQDGQKDTTESSAQEEGGQETVKGRYMEQLKTTPEGVSEIDSMVRLTDGSIAFIDVASGNLMVSGDNGDSWETRELAELAEKTGIEEIEITSHAVAPDGGVFFSYVDWSKTGSGGEDGGSTSVNEIYVYIDSAGNGSEVALTNTSGKFFYLSGAVFTGDKTLVGTMNGGAPYRIDLESGTLSMISEFSESVGTVCLAGDYLLSEELIYCLSESGTVDDTVLTDFIAQETADYKQIAFCYNAQENTLFSASAGGLNSHVLGGSTIENLLDGGLCAMGDPTKQAVSILQNDDGSFLVAFNDGEIDQYTYDKEAPSVPSQQLTVYSLNQNMTVSKAISMFRKSNPDVYVKQEIGLLGDYGVTKEDAIRNLNTRLLAGEGPDIILMDEMPLQSYIDKGVLMDLGDVANEMEGEGDYFSNVLRAYETDGGLFAVPIRFQIPVLIGLADQVAGIGDITGVAGAVKAARETAPNATTVLGTYTAEELLKRLYMLDSHSIITQDGVDETAVRAFLEQALAVYEEEQKNITDAKRQAHNDSIVWREDYGLMDDYNNFTINASGMFEMISREQALLVGKLAGMTDFQMAEGLVDNKEGMAYEFMGTPKGGLFVPYGIAGISEKSKDKELAAAFLKELMGMNVQKADLEDGFPVNADAYDTFTKTDNPDSTVGFSATVAEEDGSTSDRVDFKASWPTAEEIAALKEKIGMLGQAAVSDDVALTAVLEGGIKVLEGGLSVDEGCDQIVQKIGLYLAE